MSTIPHNRPTLGAEEQQAAARVLASGWLAQGAEVAAFESELCEFLGLPEGHAVALSSGSAALFMALHVLDGKGKSVAFPVYACSALRNAVAWAGGTEKPLDIAAGGPNLSASAIAGSAADIAIVPHMFGLPAELAHGGDTAIIEDCAQAIGAKIGGTPVGLLGKVGIFSFYATKLITSGGQGGMLVSRDKALVDAARDFREFDCRQDRQVRFNFQMTDLQAAVGRAQLAKLPGFLERRAALYERYRQGGLNLLDARPGTTPVRFRAVLKTGDPQKVISAMAQRQIKAIVPIEDWELLDDGDAYPQALSLCRGSVSLPLYPSLPDAAVDAIIECARAA